MKVIKCLCLVICFIQALSILTPVSAQTTPYRFPQKIMEDDGLETKMITGVVQDQFGFLWLSTDIGVYRYDGHEFELFDSSPRTENGQGGLAHNNLASIFKDSQDRLWMSSNWGGIDRYHVETDSFTSYHDYYDEDLDEEKDLPTFHYFIELPDNTVIARLQKSLFTYVAEEDRFQKYFFLDQQDKKLAFIPLAVAPDGLIWGYYDSALITFDLESREIQRISDYNYMPTDIVFAENYVFISSMGSGLSMYDPTTRILKNLNAELDEIPTEIYDLQMDNQGHLVLASSDGIQIMHSFGLPNSKPAFFEIDINDSEEYGSSFSRILMDNNERIWISSRGMGLYLLDEHAFPFKKWKYVPSTTPKTPRKPSNDYRILSQIIDYAEDEFGDTWLSTYKGIYRTNKSLKNVVFEDLEPIFKPFDGRKMTLDQSGNIWCGSWAQGLVRINTTNLEVTEFNPNKGSGRGLIGVNSHRVVSTSGGEIWTHTANGLHLYNTALDSFITYPPNPDFPIHQACCMAIDAMDDLWFQLPKALLKFNTTTRKSIVYDWRFGLPDEIFSNLTLSESATLSFGISDGFVNVKIPAILDTIPRPQVLLKNAVVTNPEEIRKVQLFTNKEVRMKHGDDNVQINFCAMPFGKYGKVNYQYRINSESNRWIDLGEEPKLMLLNPKAGNYVIELRTANVLGEISHEVSQLSLIVQPPWWRSNVAYFCYGALLIFISWVSTKIRTQALVRKKEQLELSVIERTKEIAKERDRSESLLLNILPAEVAEELKEKGEAQAQLIDQVTVLFTDFKDFTLLSEKLSPKDLVRDLNNCFSAFDRITAKYGIEKIKTIGDAYMAAGGLPTPNKTHAKDVINAALEIRDFINRNKAQRMKDGLPFFEIRIGIHTGPVVAGIVGVMKFQYDIWGDTVNTASRVESAGDVGKVNISHDTYVRLKDDDDFIFESRGEIQAKGKSEIEMYFVSRSNEKGG